jgi:hypothetical protein
VKILCTQLYERQLKELLEKFSKEDFPATKKFKTYLDTIIVNVPTKVTKYKKSIYFNDENIKDIIHENYIIPFYIDEESKTYLILGIVEKIS